MDDKRGEFFMTYVMSDIHGDYSSFYNMLAKINFSSFDKLFILGDVVDKGSDNLCLLEFIRSMAESEGSTDDKSKKLFS